MKLAEALMLRADYQKRAEQLKQRLNQNAKVQEGDTPAENPADLLAEAETDSLIAIVKRLSEDGVSIVFVSHRLAEVLEISSRVTVLRDGRQVGVYDTAEMTQSRLTELMTGRTFDSAVISRDRTAGPVVLEVEGLGRDGEYEDIAELGEYSEHRVGPALFGVHKLSNGNNNSVPTVLPRQLVKAVG